MRPDDFRQLRTGEAVAWSTLGPPPETVTVTPGPTPDTLTSTARAGQPNRGAVYRAIASDTLDDVVGGKDPGARDTQPQRRVRRSSTTTAKTATPGKNTERPAGRARRGERDETASPETPLTGLDMSAADPPTAGTHEEVPTAGRESDPPVGRRATPSDGPDALWNRSR